MEVRVTLDGSHLLFEDRAVVLEEIVIQGNRQRLFVAGGVNIATGEYEIVIQGDDPMRVVAFEAALRNWFSRD